MEKFSQFRDRGTQIAPFLPIHGQRSTFQSAYGFILFLLRLPFFLSICISYFLIFHWIRLGSFVRKAWLWSILGISGVWWVDLQVEGVKGGSLAKQFTKLPQPGSIIVSSFTSPLDAFYLAAIFDPIFTISYPNSQLVERVSMPSFLLRIFLPPSLYPVPTANLVPLSSLTSKNPTRTVAVFPEATPTNGRGILRFAPTLESASPKTPIYPISLRYTPADITTPIPQSYFTFIWKLLSRPTHCIRVRIAEALYNDVSNALAGEKLGEGIGDKGAEALARIGRVKRLNLGVKEKIGFVDSWKKNRR